MKMRMMMMMMKAFNKRRLEARGPLWSAYDEMRRAISAGRRPQKKSTQDLLKTGEGKMKSEIV